MERRQFLQKSCSACLGLAGASWLLSACGTAMPAFKVNATGNELVIPADKFPVTQQQLLISTPALANQILLVRRNDQVKALYMECTHEYSGLTTTKTKIVCALHGSAFDFDGNVLKEPALLPLKQFPVRSTDNNLIIQIA